MNKEAMVKNVAAKTGMTLSHTEEMLNAFCSTIMETVSGGENVLIRGFGKFSRVDRAPRVATSFAGDRIEIPAKKAVVFNASEGFKKALNPPQKKNAKKKKKKK